MKKSVVLLFFTLATLSVANLKADVIADWTFETPASTNNIVGTGDTPSATQSGVLADIGTGSASANHASATSAWSIPTGHGSAHSWSANGWAVNDYYQFSASTLGFTGINIYFEQISSSTGPSSFNFQYSTDGSFFTTFQSYTIVTGGNAGNNTWSNSVAGAGETASEYTYDLSSISALTNQATVYFRLTDNSATAVNGSGVAATGTDRVDDFTINGISAVPEPSTLILATVGGVACLFAIRRRR